jgi:hypothetical protein
MTRPLTLPVGLFLDVPPARPGRCETCRSRRVVRMDDGDSRYCSRLCLAFDAALDAHGEALHEHGADSLAARGTRTTLRAIAAVFDGPAPGDAAAWHADMADGRLAPDLGYVAAVALVRSALVDVAR